MLVLLWAGAWWSSGLTRYVEAMPRVGGSNLGLFSFFVGNTRQPNSDAKNFARHSREEELRVEDVRTRERRRKRTDWQAKVANGRAE